MAWRFCFFARILSGLLYTTMNNWGGEEEFERAKGVGLVLSNDEHNDKILKKPR